MNPSVIVAESLHKACRSTEALQGMNFTVPRGCIYGLLGPNGAGKTAAIPILMNLQRPSAGSVRALEKHWEKFS